MKDKSNDSYTSTQDPSQPKLQGLAAVEIYMNNVIYIYKNNIQQYWQWIQHFH
jgi:hypothetical protein